MNVAFAGFQHGHIEYLYTLAQEHPDYTVLGCFEKDAATRKAMEEKHNMVFNFETYEDLLNDDRIEVVMIGDYFAARGDLAIKALRAGKHVMCDKPICTELDEIDEIEALCTKNDLKCLCMLDMRYACYADKAKELIENNAIGDVRIIHFTGQHPLCYDTRAKWYFEEGKHGGTINDIGVHGVDFVRFLTSGKNLTKIDYAKSWNSYAYNHPFFLDCGQFAAEFEDVQVTADVSYASPSWTAGVPTYWEFTIWGSTGMMRLSLKHKTIEVYTDKQETIEVGPDPKKFLDELKLELSGETTKLSMYNILESQRQVLKLQKASER